VHERVLHVLERSAVRAGTTLRCRCLRVHVSVLPRVAEQPLDVRGTRPHARRLPVYAARGNGLQPKANAGATVHNDVRQVRAQCVLPLARTGCW
jgi:hypothetical protein